MSCSESSGAAGSSAPVTWSTYRSPGTWRVFLGSWRGPGFSVWRSSALYTGAVTLAVVASLETLLNLEAVDKIDPKQRHSPASRELIAQGAGNLACGFLG